MDPDSDTTKGVTDRTRRRSRRVGMRQVPLHDPIPGSTTPLLPTPGSSTSSSPATPPPPSPSPAARALSDGARISPQYLSEPLRPPRRFTNARHAAGRAASHLGVPCYHSSYGLTDRESNLRTLLSEIHHDAISAVRLFDGKVKKEEEEMVVTKEEEVMTHEETAKETVPPTPRQPQTKPNPDEYKITDEELLAISHVLTRNQSIRVVTIQNTAGSEIGWSALIRALGDHPRVASLDLCENALGEEVGKSLCALVERKPQLVVVRAKNCGISEETMAELKKKVETNQNKAKTAQDTPAVCVYFRVGVCEFGPQCHNLHIEGEPEWMKQQKANPPSTTGGGGATQSGVAPSSRAAPQNVVGLHPRGPPPVVGNAPSGGYGLNEGSGGYPHTHWNHPTGMHPYFPPNGPYSSGVGPGNPVTPGGRPVVYINPYFDPASVVNKPPQEKEGEDKREEEAEDTIWGISADTVELCLYGVLGAVIAGALLFVIRKK